MKSTLKVFVLCILVLAFESTLLSQNTISEEAFRKAGSACRYGSKLLKSQKYTKAISAFSTAIELNPYNADYYIKRGNSYRAIDDFEKALLDYTIVANHFPDNKDVHKEKGLAELALNKDTDAIKSFSKGIEVWNDQLNTNKSKASYDGPEMVTSLSLILIERVESRLNELRLHRAIAYDKVNNYPGVIEDCKWLIKEKVKSGEVYYLYGKAYFQLDDIKLSKKYLKKACRYEKEEAKEILLEIEKINNKSS